MKKITTLITLFMLCAIAIFAQAPEKFSYQAVVRNANNSLVNNAQVGVRVNILQGTATGDAVYSESHVVSSNANGLITINIGGGSVLHGSFTDIDWSDGPFFLKTDIDPNGSNDYTITSTQQLLSVPYALYSKEAGNGFSGDYNDLTNLPQIPQIPADVSAFNNDAGYITMDSVPVIPANVSAFTNDAGYLTGYTETDPQFNAWDKDYNDLINLPQIPQVPADVSAFNNDAGYITMDSVPAIPTNVSTFTNDAGYLTNYTETDPQFNAWDKDYNDLINLPQIPQIPADVSAFNNDAGYITMDSVPAIPTNVSTFTNDAGYLTDYTETDPQFNAWDKDYNDLINLPQIPQIPADVSAFNNDAGYITMDSVPAIPTNVSAFTNDVGYLTGYTETDPQFNAWDKDYNDLINLPQIPQVPADVSAFNNDAGYITMDSVPAIPTNVSAFVNDAGYLTGYTETDPQFNAWDKDYNDLINLPQIPQVPTDVSAFNNDAGYITSTDIPEIPTVPEDVSAFNNDAGYLTEEVQTLADVAAQGNSAGNRQLKDVSDPTDSYDAVNLRTLNQLMDSVRAQLQQMQHQIDSLKDVINTLNPNNDTFVCGVSQITDHEGNVYNTVQIGNQCWTKENLRTTTSPSTGTYLIPPAGTGYTFTGKQARWYNNDSATYAPMNYGLLYNWNAAVDTFNTAYGETSVNTSTSNAASVTFSYRRGICPKGWHLPSDAEWNTMERTVSGSDWQTNYASTVVGYRGTHAGKLAGGSNWQTSSTFGAPGDYGNSDRNVSGFSAVPAGYCGGTTFYGVGSYTTFWSATQNNIHRAYNYYLDYDNVGVSRVFSSKNDGRSVRCIRNVTGNGVIVDEKSCPGTPTVTDHEGNTYSTVQIGDQCWMRENLRTTTSPSTGTYLIPAADTNYTYTGKQAFWYNNDSATFAPMNYGLLYNWNAAVDTFNTVYGETSVNTDYNNAVSVTFSGYRRGICPAGWHLPSDTEWTQLTNYVGSVPEYQCGGSSSNIAKSLASETEWPYGWECYPGGDQSQHTTNATGFSAVPAGFCYGSSFFNVIYYANFWSSTQNASSSYIAYSHNLYYNAAYVYRGCTEKYDGFSVRCLRD